MKNDRRIMDAKYRPSAEEKLGISVRGYIHETTTASKPTEARWP
jgi:hypothetical protein